jgi:hypothetical protein
MLFYKQALSPSRVEGANPTTIPHRVEGGDGVEVEPNILGHSRRALRRRR